MLHGSHGRQKHVLRMGGLQSYFQVKVELFDHRWVWGIRVYQVFMVQIQKESHILIRDNMGGPHRGGPAHHPDARRGSTGGPTQGLGKPNLRTHGKAVDTGAAQ